MSVLDFTPRIEGGSPNICLNRLNQVSANSLFKISFYSLQNGWNFFELVLDFNSNPPGTTSTSLFFYQQTTSTSMSIQVYPTKSVGPLAGQSSLLLLISVQ